MRRTPHGVRGLKFVAVGLLAEKLYGSHPSRGAWIEIVILSSITANFASHPSRGAWIEIKQKLSSIGYKRRRTPHGVRGLKLLKDIMDELGTSRTPHGVRGLKCL